VTWAFDAVKETMEETYDNSGYGWDDEDKLAQLTEPEARWVPFLLPFLPPSLREADRKHVVQSLMSLSFSPSPLSFLPPLSFLVIREALFTEEKDENTAQQEHEGENKGKVLENEKETPSHSTGKKKTYSGRDKKGKKKGALVGIVHFRCVFEWPRPPSLPPSLPPSTCTPLHPLFFPPHFPFNLYLFFHAFSKQYI